jgi:hypothetical protein
MRITAAMRSIWFGLVDPRRIRQTPTEAAAAVFAVAVLAVSVTGTLCTLWEQSIPSLVLDSAILSQQAPAATGSAEGVDLSLPQRQFTGALGGTLIITIVSYAALAGVFMILVRFLTNSVVSYSKAIIATSSLALVSILDSFIATGLHVATGSIQIGLHAGVGLPPSESPMLFTWLQLISLESVWRYLAIAVALVNWQELHWRYGIVVGLVVWGVTRAIFGLMALVGWIVGLQGAAQLAP